MSAISVLVGVLMLFCVSLKRTDPERHWMFYVFMMVWVLSAVALIVVPIIFHAVYGRN